ncbi:MAG: response regulator [Janthinobacterium lividum]
MMKILAVDDEPDVPLLFEQRFRHEIRSGALAFACAHSGEEALAYLQQARHCSGVVLILSNVNVPGMSGLELLRGIKLVHAVPPLTVMITVYGDADSCRRARQLGPQVFLTKPLNFAALRQKLAPLQAA